MLTSLAPRNPMSGGAHLAGSRPLVATLDVEADALTSAQPVELERAVEAAAMEEVFLSIIGGDEAKAAIAHDLLDATGQHVVSPSPPWNSRTRPFERRGTTTNAR